MFTSRTSEPTPTPNPSAKKKRANRVLPKEGEKDDREVEKPAMEVLQDEGKASFAAVAPTASFAYRAGRRIEKERPVIGLSIVVAGGAESERPGQNKKRRRKPPPVVMGVDQRRKNGEKTAPTRNFLQRRGRWRRYRRDRGWGRLQNLDPPRVLTHSTAEGVDSTDLQLDNPRKIPTMGAPHVRNRVVANRLFANRKFVSRLAPRLRGHL